ncbi:MAG: hypothetical protein ACFB21_16735 [Opitutales bacterium]
MKPKSRFYRSLAPVSTTFALLVAPLGLSALTTVTVTDEVLVPAVIPLGINTGGDSFYASAITALRVAENFEGVRYRMTTWGPELNEDGAAVWFSPPEAAWEAMAGKVRYTLLSPPNEGVSGILRGITKREVNGREMTYLQFDREVEPSEHNKNGILLEYLDLTQGSINGAANTTFWNSAGNTAVSGDVPAESFGHSALLLRPSREGSEAYYSLVPMWASQAPQNGTWLIDFWTKLREPDAELRIDILERNEETSENRLVRSVPVEASEDWQHFDMTLEVSGLADAYPHFLVLRLVAENGEVLVDDLVVEKDEPKTNPTVFRDHYVNVLKELQPGTLRVLQMGGSDFANNLRPPLEQVAFTRDFGEMVKDGRNLAERYQYTMHDFYALCAEVGADPWYCLPGTIHPDEMAAVMEYLAGSPESRYGKIRAENGQVEPWTEVFDNIYIEFGNEAWNPGGYATGSFNGPGHWETLIRTGRESPHMQHNIVFVAGSQAGQPALTRRLLEDVPNADTYAIAPYMLNRIRADQVDHLDSVEELIQWGFAYAYRRVMEPYRRVYQHWEYTQEANKGLSIYEHSFHWTHPFPGTPNAPDLEMRNAFLGSLGTGLAVVNDALLMLKERSVQPQCQFNLFQQHYRELDLWGFVPGLNPRDQRYRPHFYAQQIATAVMGGDLVATELGGDAPDFAVRGIFEDIQGEAEPVRYEDIPALHSYAFADGDRRALIVFNLDLERTHPIRVAFDGAASSGEAKGWRLTADEPTARNEPELAAPQVPAPAKATIRNFRSGYETELPPCSMTAFEWFVE